MPKEVSSYPEILSFQGKEPRSNLWSGNCIPHASVKIPHASVKIPHASVKIPHMAAKILRATEQPNKFKKKCSSTSVPQNVTVFGNRAIKEESKIQFSHSVTSDSLQP